MTSPTTNTKASLDAITSLRSDDAARILMPGAGRRLHVVLFLADGTPLRESILERFASLELPRGARAVVLEIDHAPKTARWFGITETPTLAAVLDGGLLALEDRCEEGVCERLVQVARQQQRELELDARSAYAGL